MPAVSRHRLAAIFVPAVGLLALLALGGAAGFLNIRWMTTDVTMLGRLPPLSGFLSNLGILLWWTAASLCFFSAVVVRRRGETETFRFLSRAGALSAYVTLDDLFRIHETLAPQYAGIPEEAIYAALGLAVAVHLFVFRDLVRRTDWGLLAAALVLLGSSAAMDTIFHPWLRPLGQWEFFFEDGAKWLGIVSWSTYYTSASLQAVGATLATPRPTIVGWTPGEAEGGPAAARRRVRG